MQRQRRSETERAGEAAEGLLDAHEALDRLPPLLGPIVGAPEPREPERARREVDVGPLDDRGRVGHEGEPEPGLVQLAIAQGSARRRCRRGRRSGWRRGASRLRLPSLATRPTSCPPRRDAFDDWWAHRLPLPATSTRAVQGVGEAVPCHRVSAVSAAGWAPGRTPRVGGPVRPLQARVRRPSCCPPTGDLTRPRPREGGSPEKVVQTPLTATFATFSKSLKKKEKRRP